jgi:hypothetical protein
MGSTACTLGADIHDAGLATSQEGYYTMMRGKPRQPHVAPCNWRTKIRGVRKKGPTVSLRTSVLSYSCVNIFNYVIRQRKRVGGNKLSARPTPALHPVRVSVWKLAELP